MNLLASLNANLSLADSIGYIIGVAGIVVAFVFFYRSRKIKKPTYRTRSTVLIQKNISIIDELEVFYDKKKLNALTVTKLAFWNAGKETISGSDISRKDPLRLEIKEGYEFLSCDIMTQTQKANDFSVKLDGEKNSILISFDYIDHLEGVVLRIRHTGISSMDLSIKGSLKSVSAIQRYQGLSFLKQFNIHISNGRPLFTKVMGMFAIVVAIVYFLLAVAIVFFPDYLNGEFLSSSPNRVAEIIAAVFSLLASCYFFFTGFIIRKQRVPISLREVFSDESF